MHTFHFKIIDPGDYFRDFVFFFEDLVHMFEDSYGMCQCGVATREIGMQMGKVFEIRKLGLYNEFAHWQCDFLACK